MNYMSELITKYGRNNKHSDDEKAQPTIGELLLELAAKDAEIARIILALETETKRVDEETTNRDRWKARAEALTNDLINAQMNLEILARRVEALEKMTREVHSPCSFCTNTDESECNYCEVSDGYPCWQFDEELFATEE